MARDTPCATPHLSRSLAPATCRVDRVRRVHLDTDIGTNPDDACALAMLLGLDDVELVGVTTSRDGDGTRVRTARDVLALAGRADVPVRRGGTAEASALLRAAVRSGATVAVVGPATNVAGIASADV